MRNNTVFDVARGGWSRYKLLKTYALRDKMVGALLDRVVMGHCEIKEVQLKYPNVSNNISKKSCDISLLEKMANLITANGFNIERLACAYNVATGGRMPGRLFHVLEQVKKQGRLMAFVQDIYQENRELGIKLALTS